MKINLETKVTRLEEEMKFRDEQHVSFANSLFKNKIEFAQKKIIPNYTRKYWLTIWPDWKLHSRTK